MVFELVKVMYKAKTVFPADPTLVTMNTGSKVISKHESLESAIQAYEEQEQRDDEGREMDALMCGGDSEVMSLITKHRNYIVDRATNTWYYVYPVDITNEDGEVAGCSLHTAITEEPVFNEWEM